MKLWIVGRLHPRWQETGWGFVGVFDDEEKAKAACRDENSYVSPINLNEDYGDFVGWPLYEDDPQVTRGEDS